MSAPGKPLIVFGAGGHAHSVIDVVEAQQRYQIVGLIDSRQKKGSRVLGYPVLGSEDDLLGIMGAHEKASIVVAIGDNYQRMAVTSRIKQLITDIDFAQVVHPSAVISSTAFIDSGVVVMPGAVVHANVILEEGVLINTRASIDHDGRMQSFSSLAPAATLGGNVTISERTSMGLGSMAIQGVHVGRGSVVGAGSVVLKDVPDNVVAFGNPCTVIRDRQANEPYL